MIIKYGFEINGFMYGWHSKELYKLPCVIGKRSYGLRLIKKQIIGSTPCYSIQGKKVTVNKLKGLTGKLLEPYSSNIKPDLPF